MSISRDQSSLLASCHSQKEIEYLQAVIRTSIDKTPLKQISGIYEDENPENQRKEESNAKYQSVLQEINRAPLKKQKGEQLLEQWMGLKYQASILSFKEKSRNTQVSLRKQSSFFSCLACGDVCISCKYRLTSQSTLELYLQDQGSNKEQLIYFINFDTLKAGFSFRKQHQLYYFTIATAKHELTFSAEQQQAEYLRKKLEGIHQASLGNQLNLVQLESRHDYFKERLATQQYFNNSCATGDILLFQDDHFAAKVQRFITGSNFNHVGMVVKDPYFGVLILESNSKSGVCLTRWRSLIFNKWFKFIPKISWRRLSKVARNSSFQSTITRFLRDNLQKSFNISSRVLTANESVIIAAPDDENDEKPPGFFCSELIATLYKNLGLLTRDRENSNYQPACKFYPKDFSQLSGRKLDQGQLSPEYEIYFHPKLLLQSYPYLQAQQGPNPS